jgi:hypothetical protein
VSHRRYPERHLRLLAGVILQAIVLLSVLFVPASPWLLPQ